MNIHSWSSEKTRMFWPKREEDSHKGTYGRVGIIAGSTFMPGAAIMATGATLRSGAGLTTLNAQESQIEMIASRYPEVMFYSRNNDFKSFYEDKDSIAIGPGMEIDDAYTLLKELINYFEGILIVDATALSRFNELFYEIKSSKSRIVITPHPGEMAQIVNKDIKTVQNNREYFAHSLATELNIHVVLKGNETLTATPSGEVFKNTSGNSALAKGGSGDVLTGMIAGFSPRYENLTHAVTSAVFIHGHSADRLIKNQAPESVLGTDIIEELKTTMKEYSE